jgi:Spy/CpxP family protein refolding chaperone
MLRNKMFKKIFVGLFLISFVFPINAWADWKHKQEGSYGKTMEGFKPFYFDDSLTDSQKVEVFKIFLQHKGQKKELRSLFINAKKDLMEEIFSGSSEESLQKAVQKTVDAKKEMIMLRAKVFREVKSVLPAEAMERFKEKMKKKWSRRHGDKMARY